jgi:hypothetical protein
LFWQSNAVTWSDVDITGNAPFGGPSGGGSFVALPGLGNVGSITGSIIDAQGLPLNLPGALSDRVIMRPGTITATQTSNSLF